MMRRDFLAATAATAATTLLPARAASADTAGLDAASPSEVHLAPTRFIDADHPEITELAGRLTAGLGNDRQKALAIFAYVRDEIRFGFAPMFYEQTASQVLETGRGFCNTKSTLFIALLRAVDIPARQVFVDISERILDGFVSTGGTFVDHSYAQIWLDERWVSLDAYIVDAQLFSHALQRVTAQKLGLGYGVHASGTMEWDGKSDAFAQFVDDGSVPYLTDRRHGVYADVGDFYARAEGPWNRRNLVFGLAFRAFAGGINARIDDLRDGTGTA